MAVKLDQSVIDAINNFAKTPMGRKYGRWAKKRYGVSGKKLMAKTVAGEAGGKGTGRAGVSSAGARGPAQFIASTRQGYIEQYGVDPWKDDKSAIKGMAIHHMGTGVEGYNPGMPTYKDYILGQKVDRSSMQALRTGSKRGGKKGKRGKGRFVDGSYQMGSYKPGQLTASQVPIPGQSLEPQREALKMQTLTTALGQNRMPSQSELLSMKSGLDELQDIPGSSELQLTSTPGSYTPGKKGKGRWEGGGKGKGGGPGGKIITATGRSVQRMVRMAEKWDRKKVPYLWGGGHGSIAKPGDPVDCSGFVSAVLGIKTPMVSGDLANWGKPGKGRNVTVYANAGHVLMSIRDPKSGKERFFGTSSSNPGGGAGEIPHPGKSYLSSFSVRHPG